MTEGEHTCARCGATMRVGDRCPVCGWDPRFASKGDSLGKTLAETHLGRIVGGMMLDTLLGAGGRGAVFRGRDARTSDGASTVAVKLVIHDRTRSKLQDVLLTQARRAIDVTHPSLAVLRAVGADQGLGLAYLVSEFVSGIDLRQRLETEGPLRPEQVTRIGRMAAEGLAALHRKGVVHRDVKPSHVLTDETGAVKLVEIGFAPILQFSSGHGETAHGPIVGTPEYVAPEQAREPDVPAPASDVYSLGAVLFHLLTGRPPFVADSLVGLLVQHASRAAPPVKSLAPSVPDPLARLVDSMLVKDPARRPSAADVASALESPMEAPPAPSGPARPGAEPGGARVAPFSRTWLRIDASLAALVVERDIASPEEIAEALEAQHSPDAPPRELAEVLLERGIASRRDLEDCRRAIAAAEKRRKDAAFGRLAMEEGYVKRQELERALTETGDTWISVAHSLVRRELMSQEDAGIVQASADRHLREVDTAALERFALENGVRAEDLAAAREELYGLPVDEDSSLLGVLLGAGVISDELAWRISSAIVRDRLS